MFGNIHPFEQITSSAGAVKATKHVHEGRFAATARSHNRQELPAVNFYADTAERVDPCLSQFIVFVHVFDPDDRPRRRGGYLSFLVSG